MIVHCDTYDNQYGEQCDQVDRSLVVPIDKGREQGAVPEPEAVKQADHDLVQE